MGDEEKNMNGNWHEFTQQTSMHGIRYIKMKEISPVRRLLWGLLILGCLGYFCYAAFLFLDDYAKKLVNTKIKIKNASNLTFPTITICNRNYWKRSVADDPATPEPVRAAFKEIISDLFLQDRPSPPPEGKYNFTHDPILASFSLWTPEDMESSIEQMAHTLNETFTYCMVQGSFAPCYEIFERVKTDAGYCYRFNAKGDFESNSAGLSGGVQLFLNTLVDEYYIGPFSYSEGFSIALHDVDNVPLMSELSYGISPGMETSMIIQKTEVIRQPPPADAGQADCFDAKKKKNPLHYHSAYSYSACYEECKTSFVIRKCGCKDLLQPALNNSRNCLIEPNLFCSTPARKEFYADASNLDACQCKSSCHEIQYAASLSTYRFPSQRYIEDQNVSAEDIEYIKKNWAAVGIFYGQMSFEKMEEVINYDAFDLIANLGGTFGVCIGASLLTIIEFLEFMVLATTQLLCQRIARKTEKTPVRTFKNSISFEVDPKDAESWKEKYKGYAN